MAFPYPSVTTRTDQVNYASYMPTDISSLVKKTPVVTEKFFGSQIDDYIELSVFDSQDTLNIWSPIVQPPNYKTRRIQYQDLKNNLNTISYDEFVSSFTMYEHSKILLDPKSDLQKLGIVNGNYKVVYNFQSNIVGSHDKRCFLIKQLSPSRKEIKTVLLLDKENFTDVDKADLQSEYDCFTSAKIEARDILPDFESYLKKTYILNFVNVTSDDVKGTFNRAYSVYGSDGLYKLMSEIFDGYQLVATDANGIQKTQTFIGISQYITMMLYENYDKCFSFDQYSKILESIVSETINMRLTSIHDVQNHDTEVCNTYLFQVFNGQIQSYLQSVNYDYTTKYVGPLKNSINFGDNRFYKILSSKKFSDGSLVIKLQDPLPTNIGVNSTFWITNTSLSPVVQNVVMISLPTPGTFNIKSPNFNLKVNDKRTSNSITLNGSDIDDSNDVDLILKKKFSLLKVDYTKFENFIVYSSAQTRITIYKNKLASISAKSQSIVDINASTYSDAYTTKKVSDLQDEIDQIKLSFDGYEYYMYTNPVYNGFDRFPQSYVDEASEYDSSNRDSLINNLPEYLLLDNNNDDFLIFLSMIGHHFDNIYIYIDKFPMLSYNQEGSEHSIPNNILNNMLESFGWKPQSLVNDVSLSSNYTKGTYVSSVSDKSNVINNRILNTLPAIMKAKGTVGGVKLLLACYGVPSDLLTVREFGSYSDVSQSRYTFDKREYLLSLNTESYIDVPVGTEHQSVEFKFAFSNRFSKSYADKSQIDLLKKYADISNTSAGYDYRVYAYKPTASDIGQIIFEIGNRTVFSKSLPIFNGDVYSVMLRRNDPSSLYSSSLDSSLVPTDYDLIVEIHDQGEARLSSKQSQTMTHVENDLFSQGSNASIRFGSTQFSGSIDKINVWNVAVSDDNFSEHVNNFESYYENDYQNIRDNLYFRLSYTYPRQLDVVHETYTYTPGRTADMYNLPSVLATKDVTLNEVQSNPELYQDTLDKRKQYSGEYSTSSLYPYANVCDGVESTAFPYNFTEYVVSQAYRVSNYGPNLLWNNKISIKDRAEVSSITPFQKSTPYSDNIDSNLVGVFASPTSNKSSEILKFFGDKNIIDELGDPRLEFSQSYDPLETFRRAYYDNGSPIYSGKVLYQEFTSIYKLYFDVSIFESIRNITAARNKLLTGILVEPTILERVKFPTKPIRSEIIEDTVIFDSLVQQSSDDIQVLSNDLIQIDPTSSFYRFVDKSGIQSGPIGDTIGLNQNFGGDCIGDVTSPFELYVCADADGTGKYITYLDIDTNNNNVYQYSVPYYVWLSPYSASVESRDVDSQVNSYTKTFYRLIATPKSSFTSFDTTTDISNPGCTLNHLSNRPNPFSSGTVVERASNKFGIFKRSSNTSYYTVDGCGDSDKSSPIVSTIVTNTSVSTNSSGVLTVN